MIDYSEYKRDKPYTKDHKDNGETLIESNKKIKQNTANVSYDIPIYSNFLFTSDPDGYLKKLDITTQKLLNTHKIDFHDIIKSIALTHDNKSLFIGNASGSIKQFSTTKNQIVKNYGTSIFKSKITSMVITPNNQY